MVKEEKVPVPKDIKERRAKWHWVARTLRGFHIILGVIAIGSSVTVAARLVEEKSIIMAWVAWLAAISSALLTSMNLETKSNHFRAAWRKLNTAILRYETEDNFTIKELNDAYENAENTIGDVEVKLGSVPKYKTE